MKCRGSALPPLLTSALALASLFALAPQARADEIRLKNGAKIVGTIVSYDDGVFKIETSYGFALIRKDSIAEIVPDKTTDTPPDTSGSAAASSPAPAAAPAPAPKPIAAAPAPAAETKKPAEPSASPPATEKPAPTAPEISASPASSKPPAAPKSAPAKMASATPAAKPAPKSAELAAIPAAAPEPAAKAPVAAATSPAPATVAAVTPPAPPPTPPAPAAAPPVVEEIRGSLYVNTTYGFEMYRPPDWELIENAQKDLPNAIAALGTSDETTLFIVGRDPAARDSIEAHAAAMERTLREVYDNYRPISSEHATVAGVPALESHFRGKADEHDWSGTVVTFVRGEDVFTILAMTYADSDLIQIQENVIAKTIGSLKFDASAPSAAR